MGCVMKRIAIVFLLVLTSLPLAAQNGGTSYGVAGPAELGQSPNGGSNAAGRQFKLDQSRVGDLWDAVGTVPACPINMRATQGVWDHTRKVRGFDDGITRTPFGQRILLTLIDARPARIVSATVLVRGLNGKNHMVQTAGAQAANATKTLTVTFARQEDGSVLGDLYVPGFTSVSSVVLQRVTYADGSTWISSANVCRVTPDPMMLIAEH